MRMSPVVFREKFDGAGMLQYFRKELVLPYVEIFQDFRPAATPPGWITRHHNLETQKRLREQQ